MFFNSLRNSQKTITESDNKIEINRFLVLSIVNPNTNPAGVSSRNNIINIVSIDEINRKSFIPNF